MSRNTSTALAQQAWPDALLTTPITPENAAKGYKIDAYAQGVSAWVWGYPLVRMERVVRDYINVPEPKPSTSYRAPLNQIGWARQLATPDALDMPTPNNDTLYMSAVVDLKEPYILSVPEMGDRYYVVDTFNMWQELEHYIGRRTTGTKAGRFALVPPGWKGNLPKDVSRLDISTDKVWLWGRMRVSAGDDMDAIHALQDSFDLRPLSAMGQANWKAPKASLPPLPQIGDDPFGFLVHLAFALKYNRVKPEDTALFGQLQRIGLTADGFDPSRLNDEQKKGLTQALQDAPLVAAAAVTGSAQVRQGWNYVTGLDNFGFNYPLRAVVAGPYLGGQGETEAAYPVRYTDDNGDTLNGSKSYTVHFGSEPPNNAFWSLTAYDNTTKMLVDNPIHRYKIGSANALKKAKDGSFDILLSATQPADTSNWLPVPKGDFNLFMRIYQPKGAFYNRDWQLPSTKPAN